MKKLLLYIMLFIGVVSCNSNKGKHISQTEFNRILAHDSISSINVYMSKNQALIRLKSVGGNEEKRILDFDSYTAFQDLLGRMERKLTLEGIHPTYSLSFISENSSPITFLDLFPAMIWILQLIVIVLLIVVMIDILRNRFETDILKLIWVLVVLFIPLVGSLMYIFIGRKQRIK